MKRRHGINTSHTKHLQQPQAQSPPEPDCTDPLAITRQSPPTIQVSGFNELIVLYVGSHRCTIRQSTANPV